MDGKSGSPAGFNVQGNGPAEMGKWMGKVGAEEKLKNCNLFYT